MRHMIYTTYTGMHAHTCARAHTHTLTQLILTMWGKTPALNAKEVEKVTSFNVHTLGNYFTAALMNKEDESFTLTIRTKNRFLASLFSALLPN